MQMDANYQFRGHVLQDFPWYFYVAAVDRVHLPHTDAYAFDADHPQVSSHGQVLLRNTPWRVPILVGPDISSRADDAETRAAV